MKPLVAGIIVFGLSFVGLSLVERLIHHLTHNPDRSYRWGVWLFSLLLALYAFSTNLGR